jgi:hypothetical protein
VRSRATRHGAWGDVTVHDRFGTATVTSDLRVRRRGRSARSAAGAAEVELGASYEDLARRDFTVNAIAVRLADGAVTRGRAPTTSAGVLRVLHPARSSTIRRDPAPAALRRAAGFEPGRTDALIAPRCSPPSAATGSGATAPAARRAHPRGLARHGSARRYSGTSSLSTSTRRRWPRCPPAARRPDLAERLDAPASLPRPQDRGRAAPTAVPVGRGAGARSRLPPEAAEVAGAHRWLTTSATPPSPATTSSPPVSPGPVGRGWSARPSRARRQGPDRESRSPPHWIALAMPIESVLAAVVAITPAGSARQARQDVQRAPAGESIGGLRMAASSPGRTRIRAPALAAQGHRRPDKTSLRKVARVTITVWREGARRRHRVHRHHAQAQVPEGQGRARQRGDLRRNALQGPQERWRKMWFAVDVGPTRSR